MLAVQLEAGGDFSGFVGQIVASIVIIFLTIDLRRLLLIIEGNSISWDSLASRFWLAQDIELHSIMCYNHY